MVTEGTLLWEPSDARRRAAVLTRFFEAVGQAGADPQDVWRWSVDHLDDFWDELWRFAGVLGDRGDGPVLADRSMPGATWFPTARLNYAENALSRPWDDAHPAVLGHREDGREVRIEHAELIDLVARTAAGLRRLGVQQGDRVVGVLPNAEHALIAFLASASIGAIWSSCSPDFGASGVLDRFRQIEPTVLIGVDGYVYNGKRHATLDRLASLTPELPTLKATVLVPYLEQDATLDGWVTWDELLAEPAEPDYVRLPFDAPLWILYSSGTTGLPKPIVQGHGGIVLEHMKQLLLHTDLGPGERFFWFSTTGWMMWNLLVSGLLVGSTVVTFDGSPGYPDLGTLWRMAEQSEVTVFGTSAPYLTSCQNAGLVPRDEADLRRIKTLGSTGAPLSPEGFAWVYDAVAPKDAPDLLLASVSGGTDVCTAFAAGLPVAAVYAGEIQTRSFGVAAAAFDPDGNEVVDDVGELVVTAPMPSMPLGFWGDDDGSRLRESYFEEFPGVWRHGDWCKVISARGSMAIYGRSDSTLNRGGVRMGTAEFYRVVDEVEGVADSLVVEAGGKLLLFVVLDEGAELDDDFRKRVSTTLRNELTPRHVPDRIEAVPDVPRTLNGKKLEVPVKRILEGVDPDKAVSTGAVADPESLEPFLAFAKHS
ncbi:MAG TPA: acetoacetate--CoA ligase [Frankiaceae bacterium]|nr:acetoacetate--CoA ligase [Frankiaceae bacterium]